MHHDELWQVYAPNGEPISGLGWESERGNPEGCNSDKIVGVAVVFLYRVKDNGELEFLWQKRSEEIDRYPGYYDISAGGHINLGESLVEAAIRETYEEIGVSIEADDLQFLTMIPFNKNRFAWVWGVDWSQREDDFNFNDKEVSEVRWVKYAEMEEFRKKFAKPPLQKDKLTFLFLDRWLEMHGYL
ncbi:NUDIX domain-containing protein [Candidatus Saccharibacteria bacterium]|nr:NUDIX domain-containing protein [Candidatus Saccharibacteria bacterium]